MDIKIKGIDREILEKALAQAKEGRNFILDKMTEVLDKPRENLSKYAPKIISFAIDKDKIKDVIGSGGKTINKIIDETGVKIDIMDDGTVFIATCDEEMSKKAKAIIMGIVKDPEVGDEFEGKVVKILEPTGAFVELTPGKDGMIHISKLSKNRVEKVSDVLSEGDRVRVQITKVDTIKNRIDLKLLEIVEKVK